MSKESHLLLENISAEAVDASFSYGEKQPGAGYYRLNSPLHTAVYTFNAFSGTVKIQGTLALYPSEADWFDIDGTTIGDDSTIMGNETVEPVSFSRNFTGNFVWIRAAYNLQDGTIASIRYNY
jgi:hypothetical protein